MAWEADSFPVPTGPASFGQLQPSDHQRLFQIILQTLPLARYLPKAFGARTSSSSTMASGLGSSPKTDGSYRAVGEWLVPLGPK